MTVPHWAYELGIEVGEEIAIELIYSGCLDGLTTDEKVEGCNDFLMGEYTGLPGFDAMRRRLESGLGIPPFFVGFDDKVNELISDLEKEIAMSNESSESGKFEVSVNVAEILPALINVEKFAARKSSMPILRCVKLSTGAPLGGLVIEATNLDAIARCPVGVYSAAGPGVACADGFALIKALRLLKKGRVERVTLASNAGHSELRIVHEKGYIVVDALDPIDYPMLPMFPAGDAGGAEITEYSALHNFPILASCAAKDDTRPTLNQVYCECADDLLTMTSTDGFGMYTVSTSCKSSGTFDYQVPAAIMGIAGKMTKAYGGNVGLYFDEVGHITNYYDGVPYGINIGDRFFIWGRGEKGQYPDYRRVLDDLTDAPHKANGDRADLLLGTEMMAGAIKDKSSYIVISVGDAGHMSLHALDGAAAYDVETSSDDYPATMSDSVTECAVNPKYVIDFLKLARLDGFDNVEVIAMSAHSPLSIISGDGGRFVLMPTIRH